MGGSCTLVCTAMHRTHHYTTLYSTVQGSEQLSTGPAQNPVQFSTGPVQYDCAAKVHTIRASERCCRGDNTFSEVPVVRWANGKLYL